MTNSPTAFITRRNPFAGVLACALVLLSACSSPRPAPAPGLAKSDAPPITPVPRPPVDPATRAVERIEAETWVLGTGKRKECRDDLHVRCTGEIVIDGVIEGLARPAGDPHVDGATIHLVSKTRIVVRGRIVAGAGGDAHAGIANIEQCLWRGGAGGNVILEAPELDLDGTILAGHAGRSGANAAGAPGGDVVVRGQVSTAKGAPGMVGGNGGGFLGGTFPGVPCEARGGAGGSVRLESWDRVRAGFPAGGP
jgi:hypothetical protein